VCNIIPVYDTTGLLVWQEVFSQIFGFFRGSFVVLMGGNGEFSASRGLAFGEALSPSWEKVPKEHGRGVRPPAPRDAAGSKLRFDLIGRGKRDRREGQSTAENLYGIANVYKAKFLPAIGDRRKMDTAGRKPTSSSIAKSQDTTSGSDNPYILLHKSTIETL